LDEIRDFGALMAQAQRDNGKTLVRDAVTAQAERVKAAKAEKKRAEDVKRGYSAESIGHFYIDEDEIVRGKDGTEYTIAEGWHTVVAAVSLDGDELRQVAVVCEATSDDGTRVHVPRKMDFSELAEGVDDGTIEIAEQYQPLFDAAVERAAELQQQEDYKQAYGIRRELVRAGVSERSIPSTAALVEKLDELRERAANVERKPWTFPSETEIMAKLVRDDLGLGRSRGMHR
jgi:hypothetical protein